MNPSGGEFDRSQAALFDTAQAVRAMARLDGAPVAGLVDEADWDEILEWQPARLEWSASLHAAHLADLLDHFGGCLAQLAGLDWAQHSGAVVAEEQAEDSELDVVTRLSKGAERLARLLEGWSLADSTAPPRQAGVADLVMMTLAAEVIRRGSFHLHAAQRILDQAAMSFLAPV